MRFVEKVAAGETLGYVLRDNTLRVCTHSAHVAKTVRMLVQTESAHETGIGSFLAHNATLKITVIFVHAL